MANDIPQEFIEAVLNSDPNVAEDDPIAKFIKIQQMRENAPAGSAQDTINHRFPKLSWGGEAGTMMPSMNVEAETPDEAYSGIDKVALQHYWHDLPAITNEAGARAWMEDPNSGPISQNVEDRRDQSVYEVARGVMQWLAPQGEDFSGLTPQEYISQVIGGMHNSDNYYGPGAEDYNLANGMAPRDFDQAGFYLTRKVSR